MRVLILINQILKVCGVSSHVFNLISGLKNIENVEVILACGANQNFAKFNNLGIKTIVLPELVHERRSYVRYLKGIYKIADISKKYKIDLIHSHHHYASSIAKHARRLTGTPTILTNHGILPIQGRLNHFNSDYVITVNKHVTEYLKNNKLFNPGRIFEIPYGIPVLPTNNSFKSKKLGVLCASRFVPEKGVDKFIISVSELETSLLEKCEFFIGGEGTEEPYLHNLAKKVSSPVKFLGPIADLQERLRNNSIFVFPSVADYEGFPLSLIEAGLQSNLIISSNFRGSDHVLQNGVNCLLYDKNISGDLTLNLARAIQDFPDYEQIRVRTFNDFTEIFNFQGMVNKTIKLYDKILHEKNTLR